MRWTILPFVVVALALAAYGSGRAPTTSVPPSEASQVAAPSQSGDEASLQPITLSLSLYVVHQEAQDSPAEDSQTNDLSSVRTEAELAALAERMQALWQGAGIVFDPVLIHTIEIPATIALALGELDAQPFFQAAGQDFDVPDIGQVNGFYLADLGRVNGFAPRSSNAFFVTDEPSVHDERVSSHEIGHILGLDHALDDPDRLMFSGTNGMSITDAEIDTARAVAQGLGGTPAANPSEEEPDSGTVRVNNQGGSMEGHTPRGFAGSGTGLFVGDNLNPGFPDGDGVQVFLTFDLPADVDSPSRVVLTSDALQVDGTPFEDLGALLVEPVAYDTFGPHLFDLATNGPATECLRSAEHSISCDVTGSVAQASASEAATVQFRLYFERPGDSDQSQDLAKFFRTDSNINEPGLFTLEIQQ